MTKRPKNWLPLYLFLFVVSMLLGSCVSPATKADGVVCPNCKGIVRKFVCPECRGSGETVIGTLSVTKPCPFCHGTGNIYDKKEEKYKDCPHCIGGEIERSEPVYSRCSLCKGSGEGSLELICNWCRGSGYVYDSWWRFGPSSDWVPVDELRKY